MTKAIRKVWTFESDSNPNIEYETLQYSDGSTSCNCKGWTRRVAGDGTRSCKHTRYVDIGIADQNCVASHNYQEQSQRKEISINAKSKTVQLTKLGHRKFAL